MRLRDVANVNLRDTPWLNSLPAARVLGETLVRGNRRMDSRSWSIPPEIVSKDNYSNIVGEITTLLA